MIKFEKGQEDGKRFPYAKGRGFKLKQFMIRGYTARDLIGTIEFARQRGCYISEAVDDILKELRIFIE